METNQVSEHLQVIRTLMERSALYRRALAPIMIYCGGLGVAASVTGSLLKLNSDRGFVLFWNGVAAVALIGSFLLVRRQAGKESEPFWSPPTRRVAQALLPPLFVGCFANLAIIWTSRGASEQEQIMFAAIWTWFYGCSIYSAGFFMPRGMKLFGWIFIAAGCCLFLIALEVVVLADLSPHLAMGGMFGGLHLAYGIYLYFTENRKSAS